MFKQGWFTLSIFLIKVPGQSLTNFDQNAVYTIKAVQSFYCTLKILVGNSHNNLMFPGDEHCCAFVICILCSIIVRIVFHIKESLDKRLVKPPSTKYCTSCFFTKRTSPQILQSFFCRMSKLVCLHCLSCCCCCCVSVLRPFDTFQVILGAAS